MLYSVLRLGSLSPDLTRFDFRKTALGLTAAVAMLGTASMPATAQVGTPFTAQQCRDAKVIITSIYEGFLSRGGLSQEFTTGVNDWTKNGCQGPIKTVATIDNDETAFGEIRVRLTALRMQATAQPASFNR